MNRMCIDARIPAKVEYDHVDETVKEEVIEKNNSPVIFGFEIGYCSICVLNQLSSWKNVCKKCRNVEKKIKELYVSNCKNKLSFICNIIDNSEEDSIIYYYYYYFEHKFSLDKSLDKTLQEVEKSSILNNYILKNDFTININNMIAPTLEVTFYIDETKQKRKYYIDRGLLAATFPFFKQVLEFNKNNVKPLGIKLKCDIQENIFIDYLKWCMSNTVLHNMILDTMAYDIDDIFGLLSLCSMYPMYSDNDIHNIEHKKYDYTISFMISRWIKINIGRQIIVNHTQNKDYFKNTHPSGSIYCYKIEINPEKLKILINIERFLISVKKYNVIQICEMSEFWKVFIVVKYIEKLQSII